MRGITDLNCLLVIDDSTKKKMTNNIADLAGYGVEIIDNIREITRDMHKKTRKVILLGSFRFDGLDDLKIHKDLLDLTYYLITNDTVMADLMKDFCKCYVMDYTSINSNMLYSILYDDRGEQSRYKLTDTDVTPRKDMQALLDSTGDGILRDVCMEYIRLSTILEDMLVKEEGYVKAIRNLESQNLQHLREIELLSSSLQDLVAKTLKQNEILKEHKIAFSTDFYNKLFLSSNKYSKRPKVLYFKEYEEMIHESSFLTTLFDTFVNQGKMATKIVRLHDSVDVMRVKKLEKSYYPVNGEFLESKVVNEDYIISFGNYQKLLDLLLVNKYGLDLLIIVDCKKYNDFVIHGDGVAYYSICRNIKNSQSLNLSEMRTVTNNSKSPMSWNTYSNYKTVCEDRDTKLKFLSSREPIKRIYKTIQEMS